MHNACFRLRNLSTLAAASMIAAAAIGLALSSANPVGIAVSTVIPAIVMRQQIRRVAYTVAAMYYAAALWALIPGARNFFGPDVSPVVAIGLWISSSLLLSLPWLVVWSPRGCEAIWRAPVGIALTVFPPLGIIGWASPLLAAGILFPGTAWWGILLCFAVTGALAVWPWRTAALAAGLSVACNISFHGIQPPRDWEAVNTAFGAIAHGNRDPIAEYRAAQWIQEKALAGAGKVLIFPETVVPTWTPATDAFWQQTLDQLRSRGKTILVGARVPTPRSQVPVERDLFSADLAALRGEAPQVLPISAANIPSPAIEFAYDNAVVVRGAETGVVRQRIPVPIAMWNPLKTTTARLNLNGSGVIDFHQQRAAVLVCYEQFLTWPVLVSMAQRPTMLIAVANDYWATGTPIPAFQLAAVRAWAHLFALPYISALNR
jgi:hypothetical protein